MPSNSYSPSLGFSKLTEIYPLETVSSMNFGSSLTASDIYLLIGNNRNELYIYSTLSFPYTMCLFKLTNQNSNIVNFCKKIEIYYDTFVIVNEDSQGQQVIDVYKIYSNEVKCELTVVGYYNKGYTSSFGNDISIYANNLLIGEPSANKVHWMNILNKDSIREIKPENTEVTNFGKNCILTDKQIIISGEVNGSKKQYFYVKEDNKFLLTYTINAIESDTSYDQSLISYNENMLCTLHIPKNQNFSGQLLLEIFSKNSSLYFNGKSYLEIDSEYYLNADFTAEAWIKIDDRLDKTCILGCRKSSAETNYILSVSDSKLFFHTKDINGLLGTTELKKGCWHHVAVTRKHNIVRLFLNGKLDNSTYSLYVNPVQVKTIGALSNNAYLLEGNISNLRLLDGVCLYESDFKIPYSPLQNIANTVLLIGNNEHLRDNTGTFNINMYGDLLQSTVPPDNIIWTPYDVLKLDYINNSVSIYENIISIGNTETDYNGTESGSVSLYSNKNENSFELKNTVCISPPYSHGGKQCLIRKNFLFLSAVDEEINGIEKVGKVYVFKIG